MQAVAESPAECIACMDVNMEHVCSVKIVNSDPSRKNNFVLLLF